MRITVVLALIVLFSLALYAGDMFSPKEGLWEMTVQSNAMAGASDALAKLPPEQRAMAEQMMKQHGASMSGNGMTVKSCVTKEKLAKGAAFADSRKGNGDCTYTAVKQTSSHYEGKFHCVSKDNGTTDGTVNVDLMGGAVKGQTHVTTTSNGKTQSFDSTFTSKYLGPDCGDVK